VPPHHLPAVGPKHPSNRIVSSPDAFLLAQDKRRLPHTMPKKKKKKKKKSACDFAQDTPFCQRVVPLSSLNDPLEHTHRSWSFFHIGVAYHWIISCQQGCLPGAPAIQRRSLSRPQHLPRLLFQISSRRKQVMTLKTAMPTLSAWPSIGHTCNTCRARSVSCM